MNQDKPLSEGWAEVLNVHDKSRTVVLSRLSHVITLPQQVVIALEGLDGIDEEYLRWRPQFERALSQFNFDQQWRNMVGHVSEDGLLSLSFCSKTLSRFRPEPTIDDAALQELWGRLQEFRATLPGDLPPPLAEFIKAHLNDLLEAIANYEVIGIPPIVRAVEAVVGGMAMHPEIYTKSNSENLKTLKKFWNLAREAIVLLQLFNGIAQLHENVAKFLPATVVDDAIELDVEPAIVEDDSRNA